MTQSKGDTCREAARPAVAADGASGWRSRPPTFLRAAPVSAALVAEFTRLDGLSVRHEVDVVRQSGFHTAKVPRTFCKSVIHNPS
ncbi:hypothetical protein AB0F42_08695 [Streptomyces buecherae]|uniref:hypothetical protein n=1 Tax=Streptomyces buecherae TaxID=2763006 RepID=UPI0033EA50A1